MPTVGEDPSPEGTNLLSVGRIRESRAKPAVGESPSPHGADLLSAGRSAESEDIRGGQIQFLLRLVYLCGGLLRVAATVAVYRIHDATFYEV